MDSHPRDCDRTGVRLRSAYRDYAAGCTTKTSSPPPPPQADFRGLYRLRETGLAHSREGTCFMTSFTLNLVSVTGWS